MDNTESKELKEDLAEVERMLKALIKSLEKTLESLNPRTLCINDGGVLISLSFSYRFVISHCI